MWRMILAVLLALVLVGCLAGCVSNAGKLSLFYSQTTEVGIRQEPIDKTDAEIEVDFKPTLWDMLTGWWKSSRKEPD